MGHSVSTWQVEMGWPDIDWLGMDQGGLVAAISSASKLGFIETPRSCVGSGFHVLLQLSNRVSLRAWKGRALAKSP
jgi:hypothetical protein